MSPFLSHTAVPYFVFLWAFACDLNSKHLGTSENTILWKSGYVLCSPAGTGCSDFQKVQSKPWYPWLSQPSRASRLPSRAGMACVWYNDVQVNDMTFSMVSQPGVLPYCLAPALPPKSSGGKLAVWKITAWETLSSPLAARSFIYLFTNPSPGLTF